MVYIRIYVYGHIYGEKNKHIYVYVRNAKKCYVVPLRAALHFCTQVHPLPLYILDFNVILWSEA